MHYVVGWGLFVSLLFWSLLFSYYVLSRCSYIICIVSLIVIWSGLSWSEAGGVGLVVSLLFWSLLFSYYVLYRCSLDNVCSIVDCYMIWIIMKLCKWFRIGCFLFFLIYNFRYISLRVLVVSSFCFFVSLLFFIASVFFWYIISVIYRWEC